MEVLDLYCGLKGWSQAFEDRGHSVVSVDILPKFNPTVCADILTLTPKDFERFGQFDVILASPPCDCFSVATIYRHWDSLNHQPKSESCRLAINLVNHTLDLITELSPRWWILENPMGMLRTVLGKPVAMITQCQYGEKRMKPTDLWGKLPASFIPKRCKYGSPCHIPAPRGSHTLFSTQGIKDKELRAMIPYGLSLSVCLACEQQLSI